MALYFRILLHQHNSLCRRNHYDDAQHRAIGLLQDIAPNYHHPGILYIYAATMLHHRNHQSAMVELQTSSNTIPT
jgi:hypothetical protein